MDTLGLELGKDLPRLDRVPARTIIELVAARFQVMPGEITGKCRSRPLLIPRRISARLLLKTGRSAAQTGRDLKRDHTTILHGEKRLRETMRCWPEADEIIRDLMRQIEVIAAGIGRRKELDIAQMALALQRMPDQISVNRTARPKVRPKLAIGPSRPLASLERDDNRKTVVRQHE